MAKKIREFMTHREPPEHIWMERDESAVIGTARMGQRMVPRIRPFDLLRSTPLSGNRARAMVFEGDSLRIATEYIAGREAQLTRAADHDLVYLQFCGRSTIESESGVVEVDPGEIVLVPAAISHRSTGTDQCLRVRVATQEFVTEGVDPEKPTMQRQFAVRPSEPIGIANGGKADGDGQAPVLEHISFWDPQSDLWVERDVAALVGCKREGGRVVRKLSAFNYFTGMTGKGGARRVSRRRLQSRGRAKRLSPRLRRGRDLVSVSRPLIEPYGVGRARARPGTDVLYSPRRSASDHRQPRLSAHGAL